MTDLERCEMEIENAKRLIYEGHPETEGLLMALSDWRKERKIILETLRNNMIESNE